MVLERKAVGELGWANAMILFTAQTPVEAWKWIDEMSDPSQGLGVYRIDGHAVRRQASVEETS